MTPEQEDQILLKGLAIFFTVVVSVVFFIAQYRVDGQYEKWEQEKANHLQWATKNVEKHGTPWDPTSGMSPKMKEHHRMIGDASTQFEEARREMKKHFNN